MIDFTTPLQGMRNAEARLDVTASRLARQPFHATQQGSDTVDLSSEMVDLMRERNDFSTNVKVVRTEDQLLRTTLSLIA
jgi:flagellar hook-associated protein FlgK